MSKFKTKASFRVTYVHIKIKEDHQMTSKNSHKAFNTETVMYVVVDYNIE